MGPRSGALAAQPFHPTERAMSLPVPRDSQEELGYSCLLTSKEGTHHQVRGVG